MVNDTNKFVLANACQVFTIASAVFVVGVNGVSGASLVPLSLSRTVTTRNVKHEVDELEKQFEGLKNATLFSLIKKGKEEEDLFIKLRLSLASLSGSIQKRHERFFASDNRAKISRSQSFEEIFAMLGDYWTFLNCSLLLHIIENFTGGDVNELMQSFESRLSVFCRETTVAELSAVWRGIPTPDSIEVLSKSHHHNWESLTLDEVNSISERLACRASLQPFAFPFIAGSPGSVVLTWSLPRHLAPLFAHLLDCALLDELGIDSLHIEGVTFQEFKSCHPLVVSLVTVVIHVRECSSLLIAIIHMYTGMMSLNLSVQC